MLTKIENILKKQFYKELDILLNDSEGDLMSFMSVIKNDWLEEADWNYFGFIGSVVSDIKLDRSHENEIKQIIINL